jgi:hypothetical protein
MFEPGNMSAPIKILRTRSLFNMDIRHKDALLKLQALRDSIFNSANFSACRRRKARYPDL